MGFRFQKRIRLFPGLRINLSKTGVSTSIGRPGMTVNVRGDKVKTTVGLPGTGLSYSNSARGGLPIVWLVAAALIVFVLVMI